jgi:hypothetical protein
LQHEPNCERTNRIAYAARLLHYQAAHASEEDFSDLVDRILREWLARQHGAQGCLWKTVMLPDGSRFAY